MPPPPPLPDPIPQSNPPPSSGRGLLAGVRRDMVLSTRARFSTRYLVAQFQSGAVDLSLVRHPPSSPSPSTTQSSPFRDLAWIRDFLLHSQAAKMHPSRAKKQPSRRDIESPSRRSEPYNLSNPSQAKPSGQAALTVAQPWDPGSYASLGRDITTFSSRFKAMNNFVSRRYVGNIIECGEDGLVFSSCELLLLPTNWLEGLSMDKFWDPGSSTEESSSTSKRHRGDENSSHDDDSTELK